MLSTKFAAQLQPFRGQSQSSGKQLQRILTISKNMKATNKIQKMGSDFKLGGIHID